MAKHLTAEHRRRLEEATRSPVSKGGQERVSAKIEKLVKSAEVPNTPKGRKQAAAIAYNMQRAGRLGPKGQYRRVKK